MSILSELVDLVLPSSCICCARPGTLWCLRCRPSSTPVTAPAAAGLAWYAAGPYEGELRQALLAYKERGHRGLAGALAAYLGVSVDAAIRTLADPVAPVLVTVPSTRAAARARGGDHVRRLAAPVAREAGLQLLAVLSQREAVADSAGLSIPERAANVGGRMTAHPPPDWASTCRVLIVDDIITTGATLAEARRALGAAGWDVVAGAVIAATPRRWPTQDDPAGAGTHNWAEPERGASVRETY